MSDFHEQMQMLNLESEEGRLKTFEMGFRVASKHVAKFPVELLSPVSPQRLARAGFYYCPDAAHEDRCVCFCCNRALHSWSPEDDVVYEHCRWSPDCTFVQELLMDNIMPATDPSAPAAEDGTKSTSNPSTGADGADAGKAAPKEWTAAHGCTWPRDTVIDHLLICVHGVALSGAGLEAYVCAMRKNAAHLTQKYMEERPMMVAVDAIDWHDIHLPPEESLEQITLGGPRRRPCRALPPANSLPRRRRARLPQMLGRRGSPRIGLSRGAPPPSRPFPTHTALAHSRAPAPATRADVSRAAPRRPGRAVRRAGPGPANWQIP